MTAKDLLDTKAVSTGVIVLLVGGGIVWVIKTYGPDILKFFKGKFDPTSDQNFAYSGVNAVGSAFTGDPSWSLGGALYDWASRNEYDLYTYSTSERRWTQLMQRSSGKLFNISKGGVITPA